MSVQPKLALPHFTFKNNLIFSYLENMHPEIRKSFVATCHLQNIQSLFLSKKKNIQRLQDTIKAFCRIITIVINSNWCITGDYFPPFPKGAAFCLLFHLTYIRTYTCIHTDFLCIYQPITALLWNLITFWKKITMLFRFIYKLFILT